MTGHTPILRCLLSAIVLFFTLTRPVFAAEIKPKQFVTKNGITVFFLERRSLPIVSVVALIKSGAINDPPNRAGLANLTASLLDEGTLSRTATQISEEVDFIGASLSASAEEDYTSAGLRVLKKDVEKGFDLLSDILLNPRFEKKELDRVRDLILGSILSEKDEPMVVASRAFENLVFENHPYRNPVIGLTETVEKISQEDVRSFHLTHYLPNNTLFSIVGDMTEEEAVALVEKYFSKWEKKLFTAEKINHPTMQPKKMKLIHKELMQTSVLMGHLGIERKNPDFYPIMVMNYILGGGGFSSRLLTEIRDNRGLVYSVHSSFYTQLQPGSFVISLQTKASNTNEAILAIQNEIERILQEGVSETELSEAKSYLIGSFPLRLETTSSIAGHLSKVGFYELGLSYFDNYPKYIEKVTREDILRVAKTYLHPDALSLVVVGNLAEAKIAQP